MRTADEDNEASEQGQSEANGSTRFVSQPFPAGPDGMRGLECALGIECKRLSTQQNYCLATSTRSPLGFSGPCSKQVS